jgi:uncharacterized protein (TIGR00251 family)
VTVAAGGLRVAIRLSPRAGSDRVVGVAPAAEGGRVLKVRVSAPAEDGRANEALLRLLARAWGLPRRDLSVVQGSTNRNKVVAVAGDPRCLKEKVTAAVCGLPGGEAAPP